jgi:hypothetical protein
MMNDNVSDYEKTSLAGMRTIEKKRPRKKIVDKRKRGERKLDLV